MLGINAHSRAYEKTKSKEKNNHTVRHTQHNLGRTYCIVPTLGACKISELKRHMVYILQYVFWI